MRWWYYHSSNCSYECINTLLVAIISIFVFFFPSKACPIPDNIEALGDILAAFNLSVSYVGTETSLKPNSRSPFCVSTSSPKLSPSNSIPGIISSKPTNQPSLKPHTIANTSTPPSNAMVVSRKPIISPPAAKPSKNVVYGPPTNPYSSVCSPPFISKGSSLIVNKEVPYGAILSFHTNGVFDSNAPYNSTDFEYIIEKLSNETFLIEGGILPSGSELLISISNSTNVYLTSVESRIEVIGRIPSGASITFMDGNNQTSSVSLIPYLYKVIDCKSTLVTGGNLPQGFIIYFGEK